MKKFYSGTALGFLSALLCLLMFLTNAAAQMYLWNWFVSPLGFATINIFHSMGLLAVILWVRSDAIAYMVTRAEPKQSLEICLIGSSLSLLAFLLGWLLHFMV